MSISPNYETQETEQAIQNLSFDKTFGVLAVELLGYDSTNNQVVRLAADSNGLLQSNASWSVVRDIDLDEASPANIKSSAGKVGGWFFFNNAAAVRYVKLYDKATAPVLASDTPKMTIPIPAGAGANVEFTNGIPFTNGIGWAATTGVADNDTGAPAANDVVANLLYA